MKKTNKNALLGVYAFSFSGMANNMTMAILAYIMQSYSAVTPTTVALILTIPSLVAMVYAFFVGNLNRWFSTKMLMIFAQSCLFAMGMIFLFLGGKAPIYVLLFGAGLVGIGLGSKYTLQASIVAETVPDAGKRGTILGIATAVQNAGGVFFTILGGAIAVSGWQKAYLLWFIVLIAIVLEILTIPDGGKAIPVSSPRGVKADTGHLPVKVWIMAIHYMMFYMFLYVFALNVSEYVIITYQLGTSVQSAMATSMVTVGGIVAGLSFGVYSKILKKWTVPFMMACVVVGLFLPLTMTQSIMGVYIGGILNGFAMAGAGPYVMTELGKIVPTHQYSKAMSIYSGFMNVGMFIAVYVIAFLTRIVCGDSTNVHTKFLVGTMGAVICFVTAILIYVNKGEEIPDTPSGINEPGGTSHTEA